MSTPTVPEPGTAPSVESPPLLYAPERRTEVERLRFAAEVVGTFCCEAYGDPAVTRLGGVR